MICIRYLAPPGRGEPNASSDVAGYHKPWPFLDALALRALAAHCPVIAEAAAWATPCARAPTSTLR